MIDFSAFYPFNFFGHAGFRHEGLAEPAVWSHKVLLKNPGIPASLRTFVQFHPNAATADAFNRAPFPFQSVKIFLRKIVKNIGCQYEFVPGKIFFRKLPFIAVQHQIFTGIDIGKSRAYALESDVILFDKLEHFASQAVIGQMSKGGIPVH